MIHFYILSLDRFTLVINNNPRIPPDLFSVLKKL
jgi:hypothetical protein